MVRVPPRWPGRSAQPAAAAQQQAQSGALILQTSPDEFYIVGINVSFSFASKDAGFQGRILTDAIEEGTLCGWSMGS